MPPQIGLLLHLDELDEEIGEDENEELEDVDGKTTELLPSIEVLSVGVTGSAYATDTPPRQQ